MKFDDAACTPVLMKSASIACAVSVTIMLASDPSHAQVQLRSRTVQPSPNTTDELLRSLQSAPTDAQHALATFSRHLTSEDRKMLEGAGIRVLSPLQGTTYRVRVEKRLDPRTLDSSGLNPKLMQLGPQDRVEPKLWREEFGRFVVRPPREQPRNYVLNADGTLNLSIRVHAGVPEAEARDALQKHAQSFQKEGNETWIAVVPRGSLRLLAAEDVVQWIDAGPLPILPETDTARAVVKVNALQRFNTANGKVRGIGGDGVQVGVFDFGFDEQHGDFVGRVVRNDAPQDGHATHLTGLIGGSGRMSNKPDSLGVSNGGTAYQWRGMAPLVHLIDIDQMPPFGQNGKNPATHMKYIADNGMDLSNHSYVFSIDGQYNDSNQIRDQIIRGDAPVGVRRVPARLHITSAGNHGQNALYGTQRGYFSLTKQTKNALVVGNWDVANNRLADTSSLGPAHDGRIKPDVVAPGTNLKSAGFCKAGDTQDSEVLCRDTAGQVIQRQSFYRRKNGSSMSAAVTTGIVSLVLEVYAKTYRIDLDQQPPLPSTLRGIMIHTARDKFATTPWFSNPEGTVQATKGPDFVTGWGLVDAVGAARVVAERNLLEGSLANTCDAVTYRFDVPRGAGGTVRVTLAWDDVPADAAREDTAPQLMNDLDLVLISPSGNRHYPWKLDQKIVDAAGNEVPDAAQQCGTQLTVQRQFVPDPSHVSDTIPPSGVPRAVRGRDRLNNVEVIDAPAQAGTWRVQVIGFNVPEGPQKFSLIGRPFTLAQPGDVLTFGSSGRGR